MPKNESKNEGDIIVPKNKFPSMIFDIATIKVSLNLFSNIKISKMELASPIFIKGNGFGKIVSRAKKDIDKADKKAK